MGLLTFFAAAFLTVFLTAFFFGAAFFFTTFFLATFLTAFFCGRSNKGERSEQTARAALLAV